MKFNFIKFTFVMFLMALISSGCATGRQADFFWGNTYSVICPHCGSFLEISATDVNDNAPYYTCALCHNSFTFSEGRKLYTAYQQQMAPYIAQQEAANRQATMNFLQNYWQQQQNRQMMYQMQQNQIMQNYLNYLKESNRVTRGTIRPDGFGGYMHEERTR